MKKSKNINLSTIISLMILAMIIFLPFIPLLLTSISFTFRWPDIVPSKLSLRALKYVFLNNPSTFEALINTFIIGIFVISLDLIMAIPAAYALIRYEFKGKLLIKVILFSPIIIPPFTAMMGMYIIFIKLGLTDTILGVVLANILPTLPYMIMAMMVCFSTIDVKYEEQANILGASPIKSFFCVTFPNILPGILVGSSLTFLISASQYLLTLLVGGGKVLTLTIIMFPFINGGDRNIGSVYGLIFSAMALINILLLDINLKGYYKKKHFKAL